MVYQRPFNRRSALNRGRWIAVWQCSTGRRPQRHGGWWAVEHVTRINACGQTSPMTHALQTRQHQSMSAGWLIAVCCLPHAEGSSSCRPCGLGKTDSGRVRSADRVSYPKTHPGPNPPLGRRNGSAQVWVRESEPVVSPRRTLAKDCPTCGFSLVPPYGGCRSGFHRSQG